MDSIKLRALIQEEGWHIRRGEAGDDLIEAYGQTFKLRHPLLVHLKLYRESKNPETKYTHMKAAHDYLWPHMKKTWHYWTEARFRAHCEGWNYITYAGGGNIGKSQDSAKIANIFWLSNPRKRGVVVSSTDLESLQNRIWGYVTKLLNSMAVKLPFQYLGGNTPKILYPAQRSESDIRDTIHGMFAVAAKEGAPERTIKSLIGRHPDDELLVILDEATAMPVAFKDAFANLSMGEARFQCVLIGNSDSVDDLHGAMSTPKSGKWEDIDPMTMNKWETTQKNGVCLYFNCYDSPAIHETDPERKKALSKFLMTSEQIEEKKIELGADSDLFYRFVLGFWKRSSSDNNVVSREFLETFGVKRKTEWGGIHPLHIVGGLDPAYSTGGDQCMLRLGILGYDTHGQYVLDFRGETLLFPIPILRSDPDSADIQIVKKVAKILEAHRCPLHDVAIDVTGQGRALGGALQLYMKSVRGPIRIYSSSVGRHTKNSFDVVIKSTYDLWFDLRGFIQSGQIRGIDEKTILQLSHRAVKISAGGKNVLESKADYKRRIGAKFPSMAHSPDNADAAALSLQAAIINYGFAIGRRRATEEARNPNDLKYLVFTREQALANAAKEREVRRGGHPHASYLHPLTFQRPRIPGAHGQ